MSKLIYWVVDRLENAKPFLVAVSISPWALVFYTIISTYAKNLEKDDLIVIQGFITWFGIAYSLFLAFILVTVWHHFESTKRDFDREVDAIDTLHQTVSYLETIDNKNSASNLDKVVGDINSEIKKYLIHVVEHFQAEHESLPQKEIGDTFLESIGKIIASMARDEIVTDPIIAELFTSLKDARDARGDRISQCKQRVPDTIWFVTIIISIVWLLPYFALNIKDPIAKLLIIGGAALVVIVSLFIIGDLNNPFDGLWKVDVESWRQFLETFDPNPQIIIVFRNKDWIDALLSRIDVLLGKTRIGKRFFNIPICQLNILSQQWFGLPWEKFIRGVKRFHPNKITRSKCDVFYLKDYDGQGYPNQNADNLPIVLLKTGPKIETLIANQEINNCSRMKEFIDIFKRRIEEKFPGFYKEWSSRPIP